MCRSTTIALASARAAARSQNRFPAGLTRNRSRPANTRKSGNVWKLPDKRLAERALASRDNAAATCWIVVFGVVGRAGPVP